MKDWLGVLQFPPQSMGTQEEQNAQEHDGDAGGDRAAETEKAGESEQEDPSDVELWGGTVYAVYH